MSTSSSTSNGGIGVLGLLGIVFVVLKLGHWTEVADWSWWWVTAPFWGMFALIGVVIVLGFLGVAGAALYESQQRKKRLRERNRRAMVGDPTGQPNRVQPWP